MGASIHPAGNWGEAIGSVLSIPLAIMAECHAAKQNIFFGLPLDLAAAGF
jgi:hypothetical protein